MKKAIRELATFNKHHELNVIIEVPKGSRSKYKFDDEIGLFRITQALPFGMSFPYDFGFAPGARGDDDDPLDVLVLMDVPSFPGCVINARIAGVRV